MSTLRLAFAAFLLAFLVGCAWHTPIIELKHQATGEIAQCGGDKSKSFNACVWGQGNGTLICQDIERVLDEECAKDLELQGFKRQPFQRGRVALPKTTAAK